MTSPAVKAAVEAVCRPVVDDAGWDLEEVAVQAAGRRSVVRLVIDADSGVDLDAVARISRSISEALDASDAVPGAYTLEVTSPGIDRPLTTARHWRRNVGRLVTTSAAGAGFTARVEAVHDDMVTFEGRPAPVAVADLGAGRVQVEFNRPNSPAPDDGTVDEVGDLEDDDTDGTDSDDESNDDESNDDEEVDR